jgi:hypothetical protein
VLTDVESSTELWCVNLFQMCMGACCDWSLSECWPVL